MYKYNFYHFIFMVYKIRMPNKWVKYIKKLDSSVQVEIRACLKSISENPFENDGSVKKYRPTKIFKRRVGDYRILYQVLNKIKIVDIVRIGHRKNVYE